MKIICRILTLLTAFILPVISLYSQLCQGSLGDPIVNITFGAGNNPGPRIPAATTSYSYVSADCPNDGYYTVRNNTSFCFARTWYDLTADHTGDPNGFFMLVNASIQPSAFYLETVNGLCGNTTYEFAAWIMNVLKPSACRGAGIQPNLTFNIEKKDGTIIQTYNTGYLPALGSPEWKQYGFYFTTPPGIADVVLRIFNNSQGGCGNDLALDDITFRACGPEITTQIIGYSALTVGFCEGESRSFTFLTELSAGFNNPALQWQEFKNGSWIDIPGETRNTLAKDFPSSTLPAKYNYRLTCAETGNMGIVSCKTASKVISILVNPLPVTAIAVNSPACERDTLHFHTGENFQAIWTGVNNFSATGQDVFIPAVTENNSGMYYLSGITDAGCTNNDSVLVKVNPVPLASVNITTATVCESETIQLESHGGVRYQWSPSSGLSSSVISNPLASPKDTLIYLAKVYNEFNCFDTATVLINVIEKPRVNAGPDRTIIAGGTTGLSGFVSGQEINFSWSPSSYLDDAKILNPSTTPPLDMDYLLTATSALGCGTAVDKVHVFVYRDIYVPTAFTPDNNGVNDTWYIPPLEAFKEFEISVFNRSGNLVFHAVNENKRWDGNFRGLPQPSGVYVYLIKVKETGRNLKGTVTLIR